ncbi:CopD family protein [Kutzneria sp. NPDC051319]|uniref:copper resistance D family protein n=1 Tax=Kutzneria sp. NPDC051319 TaxID=3155047 RepID=UPI00343E5767
MAAAPTEAAIPAWWRVFSEVAYFAALAAVIGGAVVYLAVIRPVLSSDVDDADRRSVHRRAVRLLAWCGPALLVAGYLQLAGRVARGVKGVTFGQALEPGRIWAFLNLPAPHGAWVSSGTLTLVQNVCYVLAALALIVLFVRDSPVLATAVALPLAVLGTVVLALPTTWHNQTVDTQLNSWLTQLHILGACAWLGGLFGLVIVGRGRGLGERAGLAWARMWQRFSSVALVSVGAVVASGVWLAWRHVGAVGQLFTTTYGRFLLVKLIIVAAMVAAGAYNQLALTPRIARAHAAGDLGRGFALTLKHFPKVVAVETVLGLAVLTIVPFLSGSARTQAGGPPAPAVDGGVLALGTVLVVMLVASLYASYRVSTMLSRRVEPVPA